MYDVECTEGIITTWIPLNICIDRGNNLKNMHNKLNTLSFGSNTIFNFI